jgi:hypothetical protein
LAEAPKAPPAAGRAEAGGAKYSAPAAPLNTDHEYFRRAEVSDYWLLAPYYIPQHNDYSCSLASVTMVVNTAMARKFKNTEWTAAAPPDVLKKVGSENWAEKVSEPGFNGRHGVSLKTLETVTKEALAAFGVPAESVRVISFEYRKPADPAKKAELLKMLAENEKSPDDFMIAYYDQSKAVDGEWTGFEHVSPVGAFDAKNNRVLIMDVDRKWYIPYWLPFDLFADSLTIQEDKGNPDFQTGGCILVKLK